LLLTVLCFRKYNPLIKEKHKQEFENTGRCIHMQYRAYSGRVLLPDVLAKKLLWVVFETALSSTRCCIFVRGFFHNGIDHCFSYSTFYSLLHQVLIKLTTVSTIPITAHYSKTCDDYLRLPDAIAISQPHLNDFLFNCITFGDKRFAW